MSPILKLHQRLISKAKTLALAESCSGGCLAAQFTEIAGASAYFLGSVVSYAEDWKKKILHVSERTLTLHGATSEAVVKEMLTGIYALSKADYTVAVTGIAGPGGGSKETPVGTVWIAYGVEGQIKHVIKHAFEGERLAVIKATCRVVIETLLSLVEA